MTQKVNNPGAWKAAGKGLSEVGEQTKQAWGQLKGKSEGMGDIFGDDLVGGLLGAGYQAVFEMANETFTSSSQDIGELGEAMDGVGRLHEETWQRNIAMIEQIGSASEAGGPAAAGGGR